MKTMSQYLSKDDLIADLQRENDRQRDVIDWIDAWISNPVGAYSVNALDGLFKMTRDKIAALTTQERNNS